MGKKPSNDGFNSSATLNNATYNEFYGRLKNLALSIFEYKNLPNEIPAVFVEKTLYSNGHAVFVNDATLGYMILNVNPYGKLNVYNMPIKYTATGLGYNVVYRASECVLIRNNYMELPTHTSVQLFAQRLYEVERTMDVNIKSQKTPVLVLCDEKVRLSLKNLYMQYDGNQPFIFGDKKMQTVINGVDGAFKVLKTDSPYVADKLMIYKHEIWNDALTFLGINNSNTDKKERLIVDEVNANDEQVNMSAETMLLCRQEACTQINKMFGLNISVKMRNQPKEVTEKEMEEEGELNE